MLGGESNENGEKTTIGLISRKATLHVQHTFFSLFLCRCFARRTTWNFQKLPGYTFFGGNVVRVLVHFFSLPLIFTLVAAAISQFLTAATKFHDIPPTKMSPFFSISFSVLGRGRCDHHFCPLKADTHEGFCSRSMLQGHAPGAKLLRVYQRFHGYTSSSGAEFPPRKMLHDI